MLITKAILPLLGSTSTCFNNLVHFKTQNLSPQQLYAQHEYTTSGY